jgi:hypothetical protein
VTNIEDVLLHALNDTGAQYVFGAQTVMQNDQPAKVDCSELVEWACGKAGVVPRMPDGARYQYAHCEQHRTTVDVAEALRTRGALMFITESNGVIGHVVFSLGDGTTMEAKGKAFGVGSFSALTASGKPRFDKAARIPGCEYGVGAPLPDPRKVLPALAPPVATVDALEAPFGGCWLLTADGAVYTAGAAPYRGGMNDARNRADFAGRTAVRLEPFEGGYQVVASSGERYVPHPPA